MSRALFDDAKSFDFNIFIFDSSRALNEELIENIRKVTSFYKKNFLVLNKIDLVDRCLLSKIKKLMKKLILLKHFQFRKKIGIDILLQNNKNIPYGGMVI